MDPKNANYYFQRASFRYKKLHDPDGAFSDFNKAILLKPRNTEYILSRAFHRGDAGDYPKAIADCTTILKMKPRNFFARTTRARLYQLAGENQKALADLNFLLKFDRYNELSILQDRAKVYRTLGNVPKAEADERRVKFLTGDLDRRLDEIIKKP